MLVPEVVLLQSLRLSSISIEFLSNYKFGGKFYTLPSCTPNNYAFFKM